MRRAKNLRSNMVFCELRYYIFYDQATINHFLYILRLYMDE